MLKAVRVRALLLPGRRPGSRSVPGAALAVLRAPFTARSWALLGYCLIGIPAGALGFAVVAAMLGAGMALTVTLAGAVPGLLIVVAALRVARGIGGLHRWAAAALLGERVPAPLPFHPGHGVLGRLDARLRDGTGWRAVAYVLAKLPVSIAGGYAAALWIGGLIDMTYPLWWNGFRNHPPGTHLSPVPVTMPPPFGWLNIATFGGTFLAFGIGAAGVLLAPWLARAVIAGDRWLIRALLGPGALAERVRDLEESRALAVDDAAARLRRLERDLHDGAQARLVALAMSLGMAREKLGDGERGGDPDRARDLVDRAHRNATEAIAELRDIARGIHPPVLDNGLDAALATLAARSPVPVELVTGIPQRPSPAIEDIAYFCAAELLTNVAKHSRARRANLEAVAAGGLLRLRVTDDGIGGAAPGSPVPGATRGGPGPGATRRSPGAAPGSPAPGGTAATGRGSAPGRGSTPGRGSAPGRGSGLAGLAERVRTVDGRIQISSPPGGPTVITVELPLRA